MTSKKLIIFPTKKQIEYICSRGLEDDVYVVTKEAINMQGFVTINEDNVRKLGGKVDILCCHEESLYWVNTYGNRSWNYQFSTNMLDMLTKEKFKDFLWKNNIRNSRYYKEIADICRFPVVAKPVIGFGSIGVKMIDGENTLRQQLSEDRKKEMLTRVMPYKEKYFKDIDNYFIYEDYIRGEFYRTPFVVYENKIKHIFPIRGKGTTYRNNSDFHWTDFEYGEHERQIAIEYQSILNDLLNIFNLKSGVYVVEFIISEEKNLYILELSPRQTSERIARLIQLSCGMDMEKMAVDIFLHHVDFKKDNERSIRMQIQLTDIISLEENYRLVEWQEETSVYGDRIKTVYSERV